MEFVMYVFLCIRVILYLCFQCMYVCMMCESMYVTILSYSMHTTTHYLSIYLSITIDAISISDAYD